MVEPRIIAKLRELKGEERGIADLGLRSNGKATADFADFADWRGGAEAGGDCGVTEGRPRISLISRIGGNSFRVLRVFRLP
jgi:hypothetical protein